MTGGGVTCTTRETRARSEGTVIMGALYDRGDWG